MAKCTRDTHFMILTKKELKRVLVRLDRKQMTKDVKFLKRVHTFAMLPKRVLTKIIDHHFG